MNGFRPSHRARTFGTIGALLLAAACDTSAGPVDGARARAHTAAICDFGPRPPGSSNLRKVGDYLIAEVEKLGLTAQQDTWEQELTVYGKPRKVSFRNIWTEIPGADPANGPVLLLAAHYDSKLTDETHPDESHRFPFIGALDAAASCGLLLELARHLVARDNIPNIWIAWFDGEECLEFDWVRDNSLSLLGSQRFAKTMAADKKRFPKGLAERLKVMVLLDLIGDHELKIDRDNYSNKTLLDLFGATADAMGRADVMYRWNSPMTDDHVPFKNYGVAVIDLIDFRWRMPDDRLRTQEVNGVPPDRGPAPAEGTYTAWWHTELDTMERVSADSLGFVGNLVWNALPRIEQKFYAQ